MASLISVVAKMRSAVTWIWLQDCSVALGIASLGSAIIACSASTLCFSLSKTDEPLFACKWFAGNHNDGSSDADSVSRAFFKCAASFFVAVAYALLIWISNVCFCDCTDEMVMVI